MLRRVHRGRRTHGRGRRRAVEALEARRLLAVSFAPSGMVAPAVNRADIATAMNSGNTETAIAINPTDPGNIALTNQGALLVSNNAGGSFVGGPLAFGPMLSGSAPVTGGGGDPDVAFDADGRLFWTNLAQANNIPPRTVAVVQVDPTTATQEPGTTAALVPFNNANNYDKQFLTADSDPNGTSAYPNQVYTSFTQLAAVDVVQFSRSTDNGATFSALVQISSNAETNANNGALRSVWPSDVSVAPNGDVYVAYHYQSGITAVSGADGRANSDGTSGQILVLRSTDGGASFPQKSTAFTAGNADMNANVQTAPNPVPNARFWMTGARQPWVLADPARPGNVYVVTNDDPDNTHGSGDEGDVVIARSTDNGQTWNTSTIVAGPNNSHQFFPTAAIDRFGTIVVAWYDNRRGLTDPNSGDWLFDVRATYSTDGGLTWTNSFMVSDPANPITPVTPGTNTRFSGADVDNDGSTNDIDGDETFRLGEYFGIASYGGTAHLVWNGNTFAAGNPTGHQAWFDAFPIQGSLTVSGDSNVGDFIEVRDLSGNAGFFEVIVNGQRQYAGLTAGITSLSFTLGDGNDTLFFHDSPANIPIVVNGGNGNDTVIVGDGDLDDVNGDWQITGGAGADEVFLFDGNDAGNDTYMIGTGTFDKTGFNAMTFATIESFNLVASGADHTVNVFGLPGATDLLVNVGSGDDQVNIGNGDLDSEVLGFVTIVGGAGNDFVRFFDQSDAGNDSYLITDTAVTKPGTAFGGADYDAGVENLVLTANELQNTIDIDSTAAQNVLLTVNARGGNDTINLAGGNLNADIDGNVNINGGDGSDTINIDDEFSLGDHTYLITGTAFTKTGVGLITYSEAELLTLIANLDNNLIELWDTVATLNVSINGGQANDSINVGNGDFDSNIVSDITIAGGQGNDTIRIEDAGDDSGNDSYFLESTTFHKFNFIGTFTYATAENVVIDANSFNDNVFINSTASGVDVTVNGNAGDDDIFVGNGDIDSNILGDVFVHGTFGDDRLFLDDHLDNAGADTYTLTPTTFDKTAYVGLLTYTFIQGVSLDASDFANTIHVNGTEVDVAVTVEGNGGADALHVNQTPGGDITFHGGPPAASPGDSLHLTGTPTSVGRLLPDAAVTGNGVATFDGKTITFTGLEGASPRVFADNFETFTYMTPNSMDRMTVTGELPGQRNVVAGVSDSTALTDLSFAGVTNFVLDTGRNDALVPHDIITIAASGIVAAGLFEFRLIGGVGEDTLNVDFGTFVFKRDAFPDTANLTINVNTAATVVFEQTQHLAALNLGDGSAAQAEPHGGHVIVTRGLSIGALATLDLANNDMIVNYDLASPIGSSNGVKYNGMSGWIQSAHNAGAWDGPGITTGQADALSGLTTLGIAEAADMFGLSNAATDSYQGETVDATAVIVKYTYAGDANLDGFISGDDYSVIDFNIAVPNAFGYYNGDFNYDGIISGDDYSVIDFNIAAQGPPL